MKQEDDKIRELFKQSRISANPNLEHRVMQQILTEKVLVRKASKPTASPRNLLSTFIGVHVVIALLITILFFTLGGNTQNSDIYLITILITCVCEVFFFISIFDEKRRLKQKKSFN